MNTRRGFTLVELLVVLVLLTIVLGGIYRLLNNTQRISRAQAEHVDMQSNMRAGTLIVPAELRAVGFDSVPLATADAIVPDLEDLQANSVKFRAVRSLGLICWTAADQIKVDTTAAGNYSQLRNPVASQDSLMIFVENDPTITTDDRWVSRGITSVSGTTCPNGDQGLLFNTPLSVTAPPASAADPLVYTQLTTGSPVRTFEVMEYSLYQDASGEYYLGARSASDASATRQPVLGPLSSSGFGLKYYDENGTEITGNLAADKRNVRAIRATLIGVSSQNVTSTGYGDQQQAVDSVVTLVQLRNAVHR
jgi:prepilin-type N-terminal cleavage/methylation domain-containing protein